MTRLILARSDLCTSPHLSGERKALKSASSSRPPDTLGKSSMEHLTPSEFLQTGSRNSNNRTHKWAQLPPAGGLISNPWLGTCNIEALQAWLIRPKRGFEARALCTPTILESS